MKKLLTFLTLLVLVFDIGWAETSIVTASKVESKSASWTGTANETWSVSVDGGATNQNMNSGYAQVGTKNSPSTSITFSTSGISGTITKIVINCASYNGLGTVSATVGKSNFGTQSQSIPQWSSNSGGDVTFSGNASGEIVVTMTNGTSGRAMYVKSITVTYSTGSTTTYSITGTGAVTNGSISASKTSDIASGESVTITATPDNGYELETLTVDGSDVTSSVSDNKYTFSMPAHNVAVSATFTAQSQGTTKWVLTEPANLKSNDVVLIVDKNSPRAMSNNGGTTSAPTATSVTLNTDKSEVTAGANATTLQWVVTKGTTTVDNESVTSYQFKVNDSNNYLYCTNNNNGVRVGTNDNNVFIMSSSFLYNTGSKRYVGVYNNQDWRCYDNANGNIKDTQVAFYKKVEETVDVDDLYLLGYKMNGVTTSDWNLSRAPKMDYSSSNKNYALNAYFADAETNYFQFAKGLSTADDNWNGLTGRVGADSDGNCIVKDEWLDGEDALDLTTTNPQAFEIPAGLYTITADLENMKAYVLKKEVTIDATNNGFFDESKSATLTSNLTEYGGKIYYTTDGSDPTTSSSEYTEALTFTETTTLKAIAVLGYIQSEIVTRTYTLRPKAPVITPAGGTITAPTQVTITCESEGATIYYTLDGTDPTTIDKGTLYTGPLTVSESCTVTARAYVNDTYSNTTTATFTYSEPVVVGDGDFQLVTSSSDLVAGREYIIVNADGTYVMGSINSSANKGTSTTNFTLDGTIGNSESTISAGNDVNVLTLGGESGAWTFQQSDGMYILANSGTNIYANQTATAFGISFTGNYADITSTTTNANGNTTNRQILYSTYTNNGTTYYYFGNYATSNKSQTGYSNVYLYYRESGSVAAPVITPAGGIYDIDVTASISCATAGATIYYTTDGTEPSATNGTKYTGEFVISENCTVKAIAVKDDNTSSVVTESYTITKSTDVETVTLTYTEPFTAGLGKFIVQNESGFSPVWTLDGNYGVKGTSYSDGTNYAATSWLISPIIDMTDATAPEMTFAHQINKYFDDVTTQATLWVKEEGGNWTQLSLSFSTPDEQIGWTNDYATVDLSAYAGKKIQVGFKYSNPTEGSGAGTWEIQNFSVKDNTEYVWVNNIAEFNALAEDTKARFRNPVTVLYEYAQYGTNDYIWFKDETGYCQFYMHPTLTSETSEGGSYVAKYENGDIIPAGFIVKRNYYTYGGYMQAYTEDALNAGFETATEKGLADPDYISLDVLNGLDATSETDLAEWCNRYITLEKIQIKTLSGNNFTFADENGTVNNCVGFNKFNSADSKLKDGVTSAKVTVPPVSNTYYNVKAILQIWKGGGTVGFEILPIEFTEWSEDKVTLRTLCDEGVVNKSYTISNNVLGVYAQGTSLWVKDDTGQSIHLTSAADGDENFAIEAEGNTRLVQNYYDQSNWCEIVFSTEAKAKSFVNKIITGSSLSGTFADKANPKLTLSNESNVKEYADGSYSPNYYIPVNFVGSQDCATEENHGHFFFMNPKPQEYAQIVWAIWDKSNEKMIVSEDKKFNSHQFAGDFKIDLSLNFEEGYQQISQIKDGDVYNFEAIVRVKDAAQAPALKAIDNPSQADGYIVYPLNLKEAIATGISTVGEGGREVKSVKYVNVAGMVSDRPFQGVNIVVTEFTDGSRATAKMLRK